MKTLKAALALAIAAAALPATASAAVITVDTSVPAGSFGNNNVTCAGAVPCAFTDTGSFVTPTGYNRVSLSITSVASDAATNIDFSPTQVLFNGVAFAITNGTVDTGQLLSQALIAGATNNLSITGTSGGNASYSGTLSFSNVAAVPEPGTWALMLVGFGAVGFSMRRRRSATAHLYQAA